MKLTGIQIFKHLPGGKKEAEANCKKCGFPTCMAFAMKLAKGDVDINACEYVSDELKALFEETSRPQQVEVAFGSKERQVKVGNEIVMYRHDKKFINPTCIAIRLDSSDKDFDAKFEKIKNYSVERVGENLTVDAVALFDTDETYEEKAKKIYNSGFPLILEKEIEGINSPAIVSGNTVEELIKNSEASSSKDKVLNLKGLSAENLIENLTKIRKSAIEDKFEPLGFPVITFMRDIEGFSNDPVEQAILGGTLICKYSNIIVLDELNEAVMYSLLTLRQNIYTDPEKPLQIDAKVYPVGEVGKDSPVIVTTNFALTYFTVVGEIEASNIPAYLVITPSDGMSVLTAWSADKFTGELIAKTFKEYGINDLVDHRKLIIPGYVASMKAEIEEEMPDWEVIIGANEAINIVDFLREYQKEHCGERV